MHDINASVLQCTARVTPALPFVLTACLQALPQVTSVITLPISVSLLDLSNGLSSCFCLPFFSGLAEPQPLSSVCTSSQSTAVWALYLLSPSNMYPKSPNPSEYSERFCQSSHSTPSQWSCNEILVDSSHVDDTISAGYYLHPIILGEGQFGKVQLVTHLKTSQHAALKVVNKRRFRVSNAPREQFLILNCDSLVE